MHLFQKLIAKIRALFHKSKLDADMDEEMRAHIEMRTRANMESGMTPEEARYAALRQFGWRESIKETCRDQRGVSWVEHLLQDLRYGARMLCKTPGFTMVAILTLALGIGANTAIFSVVNAVLLRPLPYPDSDRIMGVYERVLDGTTTSIAWPNYADWKTQQSSLDHLGLYILSNFTLNGRGDPVQLVGSLASAEIFSALGIKPFLGRIYHPDEDKVGGPLAVVLSHALWQSRFGSDPGIVNQAISLNGQSYTVLGVMPPRFSFPEEATLWVPIGPASVQWQSRSHHPGLAGLARLKPGVTLNQARADLDAIAERLETVYSDSNKNRRVRIDPLLELQVGSVRRNLGILLGAVGLVLLIACANVANLLLARAAARQKEMAVRAALGASRWRIIIQLLTESVLLALSGAAAGLFLAFLGVRFIIKIGQESIPRAEEITIDPMVLLFTTAAAVVTGILFGLAPAWQASRPELQETLKNVSRGSTGGPSRLRHGLVVAEVAGTLVLLIGAGLLLRSFDRLLRVNPGFVYERVLTFRTTIPERKYKTMDQQVQFYQLVTEKLRQIPGVQGASVASQLPLDNRGSDTSFYIEGRPDPEPHEMTQMLFYEVGPDYFRTMGIPILEGRDFRESDNRDHLRGTSRENEFAAALNVIIIDQEFARRFWPNESPIGQKVRLPWAKERKDQPVLTVVGVAKSVKETRLSEQSPMIQAYMPFLQQPGRRGMTFVVKTTQDPQTFVNTARQQVLSVDPEQPIFEVRTLAELRSRSVASERFHVVLLSLFSGLALTLAVVGLYGVLAYTVMQQNREIGVRVALGAQYRDVLYHVLGQGMRLTAAGVVLGLVSALALARLLRHFLFEVQPLDLTTFTVVPVVLCVVAALASYLPAKRAAKVNPVVALRCE